MIGTTAALFLSLALGAAGFSSLRLSLSGAWKDISCPRPLAPAGVLRVAAGVLLLLSAWCWVPAASSTAVGWASWIFCTTALAPLPLIAIWPFHPRAALTVPVVVLALLALIAAIV